VTVKELKEELNKFPDEMEAWVCDEIEGNDGQLRYIDTVSVPTGENYQVILLRWN